MRDYFASLDQSAHPYSPDSRARAITRFQELLLIAFREFAIITDETVQTERRRLRGEIIMGIESFGKRAAMRNLKSFERFSKDQVGLIYDALFKAMVVAPPPPSLNPPNEADRPETRIDINTFRMFLSQVATWARDEAIVSNGMIVCQCDSGPLDLTCICRSALIGQWQSTSSLTGSSSSGTPHLGVLYHSR